MSAASSIQMAGRFLCILALAVLLNRIAIAGVRCVRDSVMCTRWTETARSAIDHPRYPRPQMVRSSWQTLNGRWRYAITGQNATKPTRFDGSILVPYPIESLLSGVKRPLRPDELLWYARTFSPRHLTKGSRLLIHFGAVDFAATVYVNDVQVGTHTGGYQAFTFDITAALRPGVNKLIIKVLDPTDTGVNPSGKQTLHPGEIVYTSSSGIWQTVWLEVVPHTYIEGLLATPHVDASELQLNLKVNDVTGYDYADTAVMSGSRRVSFGRVNGATTLRIETPHLWTPDDPFLYELRVRLWKSGKVVDEVRSYFGMRAIEIRTDTAGFPRVFLNGRYIYNLGVLDQGFWPDGLYTAPTDSALRFDILAVKAMGFNAIRKHVKVEPERWYYYCDKLGILVWQDLVPPGNRTTEAQIEFEKEAEETLEQLRNHPSITTWVLFNEGWESYDQERLGKWLKTFDPARLLDVHSGPNVTHVAEWSRELKGEQLLAAIRGDGDEGLHIADLERPADWIGGDMVDIHSYPDPQLSSVVNGKLRVVGEYGGIRFPVDGHVWNGLPAQGRQVIYDPAEFVDRYRQMVGNLKVLETRGLSGSIYTQPFDVEKEQNGLITYDRAVIKIPLHEIAMINGMMVPRSRANARAMRSLKIQSAGLMPLSRRYLALQEKYRQGDRTPNFLRWLTYLALALGDQAQATEAENQLIDQAPRPYSADLWRFIESVTRGSRDEGFNLLRSETASADEVLGKNSAEVAIRGVIAREAVAPYSATGNATDWHRLEQTVARRYGALGAEEVYGAEMLYYVSRADWPNFARYFGSYFATASERSEYSIGVLSYLMFEYVGDIHALESAIKVCNPQPDLLFACGQVDPPGADTYANLLYKVGRIPEALEWERRAAQLDAGQSMVIAEHLLKMEAGQPTWPASP